MRGLVLSLFPGYGLLDRAFEEAGWCVVRGPDLLVGGDVRDFHALPRKFDGVIGGPPCQVHSGASEIVGTTAIDLIPEFVRVVEEANPLWVVMENVPTAASPAIPPEWDRTVLRDWDCGGLTSRKRAFWTYPWRVEPPPHREGQPSLSVMATSYKRGIGGPGTYCDDKGFLPGNLPLEEYARLQGAERILEALKTQKLLSRSLVIHGLGNGVPLAMGRYVAKQIRSGGA